jgi:hypothetical protein
MLPEAKTNILIREVPKNTKTHSPRLLAKSASIGNSRGHNHFLCLVLAFPFQLHQFLHRLHRLEVLILQQVFLKFTRLSYLKLNFKINTHSFSFFPSISCWRLAASSSVSSVMDADCLAAAAASSSLRFFAAISSRFFSASCFSFRFCFAISIACAPSLRNAARRV